MEDFLKKYPILNSLDVSRETCLAFDTFASMVCKRNKVINIVSLKNDNKEDVMIRHIIDTAQIIDFIDLNSSNATDLGTGGGFPGITIAIMLKNLKKKVKVNLYEKSYHKSLFLRELSRKLELNTEVIKKDIFETKELETGSIMCRAFKPLPVILNIANNSFSSFKNLIVFMGKSGEKILEQTLVDWDLVFERKKSLTNKDSFLLNIKNIKKK